MDERFVGRIAGFGTESGIRLVVGMWRESPLGRFADVMIERADGHRVLLAPSDAVARYVGTTYTFDEVRIVPVSWRGVSGGIEVTAGELELRLRMGGLTPLGRLLRTVPGSLATRPWWLTLISPVAALLVPGVRTAGTAGGDRREFYGVTAARRIRSVDARWGDEVLGALRPLDPPVRFGFSSAPPDPQLVDVVTTIRRRRAPTSSGS